MRLSRQLEEAFRQGKVKVFGNAMGMAVTKSMAPELTKGDVGRLKPSVVYQVSTPKPHDEFIGYVVKKGKQWYYAKSVVLVPHKKRSAMDALRALIAAYIRSMMKTVQGNPESWGNTVDDALKALGCPILQKHAKSMGFVERFGGL